jgi:drug/metabolite transporter (DMT)-like permease
VWLKHLDAVEHGLMMTATGLLVSLPLFVLTWWVFDGSLPETIPLRAGLSIVYLAVFGSVIGFSLYYFLIHQIEASRLALVTLITPVTALLIGRFLNDEPLTLTVYLGTGLILTGLASYQWGKLLWRQP